MKPPPGLREVLALMAAAGGQKKLEQQRPSKHPGSKPGYRHQGNLAGQPGSWAYAGNTGRAVSRARRKQRYAGWDRWEPARLARAGRAAQERQRHARGGQHAR